MNRDLRRLVPHSYLSLQLIWICFVVGPSLTRLGCAQSLLHESVFGRGDAEASNSEVGGRQCERQASFRQYWRPPNSLLAHAYRALVQIFKKKEKLLAVYHKVKFDC